MKGVTAKMQEWVLEREKAHREQLALNARFHLESCEDKVNEARSKLAAHRIKYRL
jgi:hypothetical protein